MAVFLKCLTNDLLLNKAEQSGALAGLPDWDLSDLYSSPECTEITNDVNWLKTECKSFAADYETNLSTLDDKGMLNCITRYETIEQVSGRIMSYAGLRHYQETTNETTNSIQ